MRDFSAARIIVIAVFVLVTGIPFAAHFLGGGTLEDFDWLTPLIPIGVAAVVIPVTFAVFRPPRHARREFRGAPLGLGTLVSSRHTGSTTNDMPELELVLDVQRADGTTFRASTREHIDLGALAQLVPGAVMPVRHLPDERIALDPTVGDDAVAAVVAAARAAQGKLAPEQQRVARDGVAAKAVIRRFEPTGAIQGGEAVVRLEFTVTRPDGSTFEGSRELPLPPVAFPGLQPGSIVDVRYLPHDESYVAVSARMV